MTDPAAKEEIELLGSPIERRLVSRLFVIGGPVGLAVAIVLSLWVSQLHVSHSLVVQVEPQWVPGETLALRVQVTTEGPQPPGPARVELAVEQEGQRHALPSPNPVEPGGMAQGRVEVPSLTLGPATLHVHVEAPPFAARDEVVEIAVVSAREPVAAKHVVSSSLSQHSDDSGPQPAALKIDVRPFSRVTASFDNELLLRVTDAEGRFSIDGIPAGPVRMVVLSEGHDRLDAAADAAGANGFVERDRDAAGRGVAVAVHVHDDALAINLQGLFACCVPHDRCGDQTFECCDGQAVFNPSCDNGMFVCSVGTPTPIGTCL